MIIYENECVGCDYCINCGRDKVPYLVCDECIKEILEKV